MRVIESFNKFVLDGGNPDQFNPQPENESVDTKPIIEPEAKPEESREAEPDIDAESKKNVDQKSSQEEAPEENFFKMFEKENLPDISAANMTCLSPGEVQEYQNKMKDCKYLIGTGSK